MDEFNRRAEAQGISAEHMFATQGDLLADNLESAISGSDFYNLDLLTCSMAFHHLEDPALAAKRMAERLKPGTGILFIIDLTPDGSIRQAHNHGANHGHGSGHGHNSSQDPLSPHGQSELHASVHASDHTIAHDGFSKERMEKILQDAGIVDVDYIVLEEPFKFGDELEGMEKKCFLARGRRAA